MMMRKTEGEGGGVEAAFAVAAAEGAVAVRDRTVLLLLLERKMVSSRWEGGGGDQQRRRWRRLRAAVVWAVAACDGPYCSSTAAEDRRCGVQWPCAAVHCSHDAAVVVDIGPSRKFRR